MKKIGVMLMVVMLLMYLVQQTSPVSQADNQQCPPGCNDPSESCTNQIKQCLQNLNQALSLSQNATRPLESQLTSMRSQIDGIKQRVSIISQDLVAKKKYIDQGYKNLQVKQQILYKTVRDFYIKSAYNVPIALFIANPNATQVSQVLAYQKAAADQDKAIITNIALSITDLETKKRELESEQANLASLKVSLDEQSAKLDKVVLGAKQYQATLSKQIAQLSAQQQQLLAQKLASLHIPQSAYTTQGGCVDDRNVDPGFSPRFAFFTYGVPNRVGLNQYGAWGRAKAGQDYQTILHAYYNNFDLKTDYDQNVQIHVVDSGIDWTGSIEDYVKRVYEIPDSWTENDLAALKAQSVAARSYALAYTNNGQRTICATEQCQVFKNDPKGGNWNAAADATKGVVMVQGGNPVKAWFSSTHGGYMFSSGAVGWSDTSWTKNGKDTSTESINSFSDLSANAYDKDSPWFYCDWGSRSGYHNTAWLKPEELADIVNVLLLAKADSSTQNHLVQVDKSNPDGTDTWDQDRVKRELSAKGQTPFSSISSVSVDWDKGSGRTTSVTINGDGGSKSFDGGEFKSYFNLRAPANIQIVGPLYNSEVK